MPRPNKPGPKPEPFVTPDYELSDAGALQALLRGEAMPHQQQAALDWIINQAAGTYDLSFRPGADGSRLTDFAEGRRFVGLQIVKLLKLDIRKLQEAKTNG